VPVPPGSPTPGRRPTVPPVGVETNRVIDLTDSGRAGRTDVSGAVPVQWFADDADDADANADADNADGPNGARGPVVPVGVRSGTGAAAAPAAGAIPRRVRGAQLPDLGPAAEPVLARPDDGPGAAESLRWQLRSFQLDVQAARRAITESDQAEPIHGHHPESE
jgi:hypothetical protein